MFGVAAVGLLSKRLTFLVATTQRQDKRLSQRLTRLHPQNNSRPPKKGSCPSNVSDALDGNRTARRLWLRMFAGYQKLNARHAE